MVNTKSPVLLSLLAATALLIAGPQALADAPASSAAPVDEATATLADAHFARGKELVKQGKSPEARVEYQAAFKASKSYQAAGNLGSLEVALGFFRDAAEHLTFAVRHHAPSGTTPAQLQKAKQRLHDAKLHVAEVTIGGVNVAGAEVLVDSLSVGEAPFEDSLFLEPGSHVIEARRAGFETAKQSVEGEAGRLTPVTLDLAAAAPR